MRHNLAIESDALASIMRMEGVSFHVATRTFEEAYLRQVLRHHEGNQCKAAEEMGIHRNTLARHLKRVRSWAADYKRERTLARKESKCRDLQK